MRAVGQSIGHSNWVLELEWVLERHCARLHRRTFWPAISCVEVVFSLGPTIVFFCFFFHSNTKNRKHTEKKRPRPPTNSIAVACFIQHFLWKQKSQRKGNGTGAGHFGWCLPGFSYRVSGSRPTEVAAYWSSRCSFSFVLSFRVMLGVFFNWNMPKYFRVAPRF